MLPEIPDSGTDGLSGACLRVMLKIALHQQEPLRSEMLQIMRDDGWLE
jgi:hypothetical protein